MKKYKYLFGVRSVFNKLTLETKLGADFFLELPNDKKHYKNFKEMKSMIKNKIFPTSKKEALEAFNFSGLAETLNAIKYMTLANNLSVHMINTDFPFKRKDFKEWIELANKVPSVKDFLKESRINI